MVSDWKVIDNTDSDHKTLVYNLKINSRQLTGYTKLTFNTRKADWSKFSNALMKYKPQIDDSTIDSYADSIISTIQRAAKDSMPSRKPRHNTGKHPWWNGNLKDPKRDLGRSRRNRLHFTNRPAYNAMRNAYYGGPSRVT